MSATNTEYAIRVVLKIKIEVFKIFLQKSMKIIINLFHEKHNYI